MEEENKEESEEEKQTGENEATEEIKFRSAEVSKKIKKNPWIIVSAVLAVIIVVLLILVFKGGITGGVIGVSDMGESALEFFNTRLSETPGTLESVEEVSGIYKVMINSNGQSLPLYFTKDGKWIYPGQALVPITAQATQPTQQAVDVPKSDKPKVEAFVFSYCPYGLQFEKALLPVYKLLKDKSDIELVAIGAMHGEFEKQESLRQICIEKEYGKDKLWEYLDKFMGDTKIGDCSSDMECSKPLAEKIMTQIGIDKNKINNCMQKDAEEIYQAQNARASELGVSGSPTFVINDVEVQVGRNAEAIKEAVCNAFTEKPEECSQTLSSESTSSGFGYSASSSGGNGTQCG